MSSLSYVIFLSSILLEICLFWRLLRASLWRHYPYFSCYVLYTLLADDLFLFVVMKLAPGLFRLVYWQAETLSAALRFLVILEIFRHMFPRSSAIRTMALRWASSAGSGLALLSLFWALRAYRATPSPYYAMERGLGFLQAALTLAVLLLGRYYQVQMGRNVRGMALGLGGYVSLSVIHFALIDLCHWFLPYWRVLVPLSFTAMLAVWIWALFDYAPNPSLAEAAGAEPGPDLDWWAQRWARTVSLVRRSVHP